MILIIIVIITIITIIIKYRGRSRTLTTTSTKLPVTWNGHKLLTNITKSFTSDVAWALMTYFS